MIYLIIAYLFNIIDYIFTAYWVSKFGICIESNPFGRWMFENNVVWVFKILIAGGLFILLGYCIKKEPRAAWIAYIPLAVYGLIVSYHIWILIYTNLI
jgi:NhaP-type Na+/H+ or K+/H+ antiporter